MSRDNKRLARLLREAKLRIPNACIEDIDYAPKRELDRKLIRQLGTCAWIAQHANVIITGATGTGKSYLACALAQQACRSGYRALYRRMPRLLEELALAHTPMAATRACSGVWRKSPCSSSTTGESHRYATRNAASCSKSSMTDTGCDRRSSPPIACRKLARSRRRPDNRRRPARPPRAQRTSDQAARTHPAQTPALTPQQQPQQPQPLRSTSFRSDSAITLPI